MRRVVYEINGIETVNYKTAETLKKLYKTNYNIRLDEIKPEELLKPEDRKKMEEEKIKSRNKRLEAMRKKIRGT